MPTLTPEQIKRAFAQLPEDLKDAIFSTDISNAMQMIGKKYNLMIDKIGDLSDEANLVMMGITPPKEFISNLVERLNVDKQTAYKIAQDVNDKVFSQVRESLKSVHGLTPSPVVENKKFDVVKDEEKAEEILPSRIDIMKELEKADDITLMPAKEGSEEISAGGSVTADMGEMEKKNLAKAIEFIEPLPLTETESVEKKQIPLVEEEKEVEEEKQKSPFEKKLEDDMSRIASKETIHEESGESGILVNTTAESVHKIDPYREPIE